jgi:hypothetical protein
MRLEAAEIQLNGASSNRMAKGRAANSEDNFPKEYTLLGNYPNPFNPSTTISYTLPFNSSIELTIYDIMGREVKSFNITSQPAGYQSIVWDGRNENGNLVQAEYIFTGSVQSLLRIMKCL